MHRIQKLTIDDAGELYFGVHLNGDYTNKTVDLSM